MVGDQGNTAQELPPFLHKEMRTLRLLGSLCINGTWGPDLWIPYHLDAGQLEICVTSLSSTMSFSIQGHDAFQGGQNHLHSQHPAWTAQQNLPATSISPPSGSFVNPEGKSG